MMSSLKLSQLLLLSLRVALMTADLGGQCPGNVFFPPHHSLLITIVHIWITRETPSSHKFLWIAYPRDGDQMVCQARDANFVLLISFSSPPPLNKYRRGTWLGFHMLLGCLIHFASNSRLLENTKRHPSRRPGLFPIWHKFRHATMLFFFKLVNSRSSHSGMGSPF